MGLAQGQVLQDRYIVAVPLGQGGMAAVYQAVDRRLNVTVAIKEMIPIEGVDAQTLAQFRKQFEQEAMVLARLNHPHLVRVTDFFEAETNAYLVMDFVEGENLAQRIERSGALAEAQVLEWASELLDALAYCHDQGVIHRDIKPQNVIIRPDDRAVLVDFGLVKLWNPNDPRTKTVMRGMGTPEYSPPEQYDANQGHTDPRSDIYSLGATLYHGLAGEAPPTATLRIADPDCFIQPWAKVRGVHSQTQTAIAKALELARPRRWQSAAEMAVGLGMALQRRTTGGLQKKPPVSTDRRRLPVWIWGVGVLLLLGICVGGATAIRLATRDVTPTPTVTYTLAPVPTREPPTSTVKPIADHTVTPHPTSTVAPTSTPDRKETPTGASDTSFTPTPIPSATPTTKPASTRTPQPVATATGAPATLDLILPEYGSYRSSQMRFVWTAAHEVSYQVALRHLDYGRESFSSEWIYAGRWDYDLAWIAPIWVGNWEWYVTSSDGVQSKVKSFNLDPQFGAPSEPISVIPTPSGP